MTKTILKCKKIKGIDKSVCTCEQKIAYNYAFAYALNARDIVNSDKYTEMQKDDIIQDCYNMVLKAILRDEKITKKYNTDAIMVAFRQGFRKYCEHFFIAADYESIGKCFSIPYEIR